MPTETEPETVPVLAGDVIGSALFRLSAPDVPALRRQPGPVPDGLGRVPPSLLRNSDEQTVAGTAAVFTAMETMGLSPSAFEYWGVVAATRFLGRANLAVAVRSFDAEGVWGVSPHLIPHFALHSASGTLSLALGLHGPNLGVGGGPHAAAQGFLTALTWLAAGVVRGVWLVLSGWTPELSPDPASHTPPAGECQALALALTAVGVAGQRPSFRAVIGPDSRRSPAAINLVSLAENLGGLGGELYPSRGEERVFSLEGEAPSEPAPRRSWDRASPSQNGSIPAARSIYQIIATDPSGRLRIELVNGLDGPK